MVNQFANQIDFDQPVKIITNWTTRLLKTTEIAAGEPLKTPFRFANWFSIPMTNWIFYARIDLKEKLRPGAEEVTHVKRPKAIP